MIPYVNQLQRYKLISPICCSCRTAKKYYKKNKAVPKVNGVDGGDRASQPPPKKKGKGKVKAKAAKDKKSK